MIKILVFILVTITVLVNTQGQNFDLSKKSDGTVMTSRNDMTNCEIVIGSDWQSIFLMEENGSKQLNAAQFILMEINSNEFSGHYISSSIETGGDQYIFKILTEGSIKLLTFQGVNEIEKGFYVFEEGEATKLTQKNFYGIFGKFKKIIKDYIFSHALDIRNSNDLIQIFNYYNQDLRTAN